MTGSLERVRGARQVGVIGFGREGKSFLDFLKREAAVQQIVLFDDRAIPDGELAAAGLASVRNLTGPGGADAASDVHLDVIFRSPGVSIHHHPVLQRLCGVPVVTSAGLWLERYQDARSIVITGTKGKSTTAAVLHHVLLAMGRGAVLGGNIGVPLLDIAPGRDESVLELSSYQIADLAVAPHVGVILNLYPEHVDWHGSVEQYYADKCRLLTQLCPRDAIVNGASETLRAQVPANRITRCFGVRDGYHVQAGGLWHGVRPVPVEPRLRGEHNLLNICAVLEILRALGLIAPDELEPPAVIEAINGFAPLAHRLEEVGTIHGRLYVNDSISTTPESILAALSVYRGRPVTLILGGYDRAQDYGLVGRALAGSGVMALLGLPNNGARALEECGAALGHAPGLERVLCASLEEAMERAARLTPEGGVVLLSPGAPSYGQFRNFEDRGERFRTLARARSGLAGQVSHGGG